MSRFAPKVKQIKNTTMKIKNLLNLILLCSLLSSCMTDINIKDINTDISLNPALALPIGNVHAYMMDLLTLTDSSYINEDVNNGIYVYYKSDNSDMNFIVDEFTHGETLEESITLRNIPELSNVFDILDNLGVTKAPIPQGEYAIKKETLYHFGFNEYIEGEKDIHIDSAIIQHAEIFFEVDIEGIELTENTYITLDFYFPGLLDEEKANYFTNIKIKDKHYIYRNSMDHFIAHFNIDTTKTNAIDLIVDFKIITDGNSDIYTDAKINFKTDIKFMLFDEIYGHIWQKEKYKYNAVSFNMPTDLFASNILQNNKILFSNPQLKINLTSNIGIPMLLQIENFHYFKNGKENIINTKNNCKFPIDIPQNSGETYHTYFELNNSNSPISELLSEFPKNITLDWVAYTNDSIKEHMHYLINPIIANMDFELTIPFQFDPTSQISYRDTISADLEYLLKNEVTDIVNIDTLNLHLDITNSLPAKTTIKLYCLDENNNLLFESKEFTVEAAEVDGEGRVLNPTTQNKEVGLSSNLAKEIINTKNIAFEIALTTKDNNSKLYIQSTDKIDINLSAYAKTTINITNNSQE